MRSERAAGPRRVDAVVQRPVGGLEAQQVAVGAGLRQAASSASLALAQAQRDGQAGLRLDAADDVGPSTRPSMPGSSPAWSTTVP